MSQRDVLEIFENNKGKWLLAKDIFNALKKEGANITKSSFEQNMRGIKKYHEIIWKFYDYRTIFYKLKC